MCTWGTPGGYLNLLMYECKKVLKTGIVKRLRMFRGSGRKNIFLPSNGEGAGML